MGESRQYDGSIFEFLRTEEAGARLANVADGQIVFQPNDPAVEICLIEFGEIRLFDMTIEHKPRLLEILGPGDLFGLAALGTLDLYGIQAVSVGNSTIRAVPASHLLKILSNHGDLAVQFVEILALQLHGLRMAGEKFMFTNLRIRLIQKLIWFAKSPAACPCPGGVALHITHEELAQVIGATRETVTVCLTDLRKRHLVETRRNCVIYDPSRLTDLCPDVQPMRVLNLAG